MVLLVGITGATGVVYGIRLLEVLSTKNNIETHLIISDVAGEIIRGETNYKIEDVKSGMKLNGVVTNVTAFGAFVDIGVHQDGLVHISQLADYFVKDPRKVVKVNQRVKVTVLDVDLERKRISLSMKENGNQRKNQPGKKAERPDKKKEIKIAKKNKPRPFNNPFAKAFQ